MSIQQNAPNLAITAGATLTRYLLVKADGTLCGVSTTRTHIGVAQEDATSGKPVTLRMAHAGTAKIKANAAIAVGATVYYDANGTIGTTSASNTAIGIAMEAASGAGSIIEVMLF